MARLVSHAQRPRLNAKAGDTVWHAEHLALYGEMVLLTVENDRFECRIDPGSPYSYVDTFFLGELTTADELKKAA